MIAELPKRKSTRLKTYDYNQNGAYFVTICTQDRKCILGEIVSHENVGGGVLDAPKIELSKYGKIIQDVIKNINVTYSNIKITKWVIMPNHIHMIINIESGTSGTPSPTNAAIPKLVSTLKRFCNKQMGGNIFQRSFHDHIIRDEKDFLKIWQYIDTNHFKWREDCFYTP